MHGSSQQSLHWRSLAVILASVGMAAAACAASVADLLTPSSAESTEPESTLEVIAPVAPVDIPTRADTDERFVQDVVVRARQPDPTETLRPRLKQMAAGVGDLAKVFQQEEVGKLPVVRLESLASHWDFYDRQLADWRQVLQEITARYSADAAQLSRLRATWEATRDVASLPPALANRARVLARQVVAAEQALSRPLGAQLELGRMANSLQASIEAGKKNISAAIDAYDNRLGTADVPPLWDVWTDPSYADDDALQAAKVGLEIEMEFLKEFTAANEARLRFNNVLAVLLLPLLLWLSARSRKLVSDDDHLKSSTQVLTRPFSAWLVLSLVMVPFLVPDAPVVMQQTALLLAVIPVLRLLPRRVYDILGAGPYIITGIYVLHKLGFLLLGHPLYSRLHLLGLSILTLLALAWLLVSRRHASPTTFVRALRFVGIGATIALAVSIIANTVGNLSFAEVITNGVIASAYLALALHAGSAVLISMVRLLMARKTISRFNVVTQRAGPLLRALGRLLEAGAVLTWVITTLSLFRVYRPVAQAVREVLFYPIELGKISVTAGSILLFALSVWIAFWFARTIRAVLQDDVLPKMALPRGVGNSVSTLSYYALITIGLLVALAAAGFETSQFAIVFGALGVGIGFGLQNIVNNFVSGLILMFERPIQPGDVVEVSGTSGTVREIGMRATTLTTFDGADVVVPNGTLLSEKLINWTLSNMNRRIDVDVGVAYGSDPRQVMELLAEIARTTPGITDKPEPSVVFLRFGASSLEFGIRAWTNDFSDWVPIRSQMTIRIYDALRELGIAIPFPQQDLHLRTVSPEAAIALSGGRPGGGADKTMEKAFEKLGDKLGGPKPALSPAPP
jgi:potassium efflux system protein